VATTDANGHSTRFEYDELNRLTRQIDALGGVSSITYDAVGNIVAQTDELGRTTRYAYDSRDRQTQITDALNGITKFGYDAVNNLLSLTDQLNRTTQYSYDALNRRIKVTDPLNHATTYAYDGVDNLTAVTDALGHTTSYSYDVLNRRTAVTNALGDTATITYDAINNITAVTDELGRTTKYSYDKRNWQAAVTDPLGNTTTRTYDANGNVVAIADTLGHTTRYRYDALNRQSAVIDALNQTTTTTYDALGNILSITDPVGNTTSYTYDALDRLITDTNQLDKTRSYSYDAVGNRIAATDRNGRKRTFTYDALDRQSQEKWLDASGNAIRMFSYSFDAASQLTTANDPNSAYNYTYDVAGRLTSVNNTGTLGVPNVLLNYTYDGVGNRLSVTDTINGQLRGTEAFTYDELNRVIRITHSGNGVADKRVDMAYDAASQMTSLTRYADLIGTQRVADSNYIYDLVGRLTRLTHAKGATTFADYTLVYDAANRITSFTSPDGTSNYSYDVTDQLLGTDHSYQNDEAYSYDANGNRTNTGYQTGTNNRLLSDGRYTYEYDGEGNRTKRTEIATSKATEYTWDYRNRLTRVVTKDAAGNVIKQAEYTYDVFDRRIAKSVDPDGSGSATATVERLVYDGDNIALVFDGNGNQTHRYLYGPGVDQILADENASGQVLWALSDNQGTVRDLVDSAETIQNDITYDSFGQITSQTNPTVDTRYGYTGREFDAQTGQYYYRARYYDPGVGRFISEDPIEFDAGDPNLYRYVFNNPINLTDPSGNIAWVIPVIVGGLVLPLIADALAPDGVQAPTNPCDIVPGLDNSNKRAVIEIGLGMGVDAAPGVAKAGRNIIDDALKNLDNFRPPSPRWEPVPVGGGLSGGGSSGAPGGFGPFGPGLGTQSAAGGALGEAGKPFLSSGEDPIGLFPREPKPQLDGSGFQPPKATYDKHGRLTNGKYTLDQPGMEPHTTGSLAQGKSQFLSELMQIKPY
jgi:RHS repeat-associated protein